MKKLPVIYTSAFFMSLTLNAMLLGMVFFSKEVFGATPTQTGTMGAAYNFSYLIACILLQPLMSRWAAHKSLVVALAVLLIGLLTVFFAPSIGYAYLGQCICGAGTCFFWPPLMGWLSEGLEGGRLGRVTGFYNLCWSSGTIISPLLTGYLCDFSSKYVILYCLVTFAVILFMFGYLHVKLSRTAKNGRNTSKVEETTSGHETYLRYPSWVGVACAWYTVGFLVSVYPLVAEDILMISRVRIGSIIMCRALASTAAMTALGLFSAWQFKRGQLLFCHAAMLLSVFFLGFARTPGFSIVLVALTGLAAGHVYTNSIFHGVAGSKNRTKRMAIHEILLSLGSVVGSISGGFVYEHCGIVAACSLAASVMLVAVLYDVYIICRRSQRT